MKRLGNLYEKIISIENLILADENARKGKSKSYGVILHDKNREENIKLLHERLKRKIFNTSIYHTFKIFEPKERIIYRLPYYPDRILHHAVMNVMCDVWTSIFTSDTFSCIKGRGIDGARKKIVSALKDREQCRYCLKIDIRKFYPSVDHEVLKSIISRKIKCKDTLFLLYEIIDSAPGIPIGNYLSQYFANLMLAYFDHYVKEILRVKYYFRYADDMVFLANNKNSLHKIFMDIKEYLSSLKLEIKGNYQIFPIGINHRDKHARGLDFVGYVFYLNEIRMRKSIKKNFCRKVKIINKRNISKKAYSMSISSYIGWAKYSNSNYLLNKILK